jgi:hypothetical protein
VLRRTTIGHLLPLQPQTEAREEIFAVRMTARRLLAGGHPCWQLPPNSLAIYANCETSSRP